MNPEEKYEIRDDLLSWIIKKASLRNPGEYNKWKDKIGNNDVSTALEVSLIVEGIEVPIYEAFDDLSAILDELIRDEAIILLEEKIGDLVDNIEELKDKIETINIGLL